MTFTYGAASGRGRLARDRRRPRPGRRRRSGSTDAGIELTSAACVAVDGAQRTSARGRLRDRRPRPPGRRSRTRPPTRASSRSRTPPGCHTHPLSYVDIPRATFCTPNVASFGLTEEQAREQGHDVVVGKVPYGAVGAGTVYGDRTGIVKIVGERRYGELLGGHIVGTRATELIQELVNVRALEGGFAEVARIVHGHPTLSEAVMEAAPRRRRLADPRVRPGGGASRRRSTSTSPAPRPTSPPSGCCACCPSRASGSRCSPRRCPAAESFEALPLRARARGDARERRAPRGRASRCQPLRWPDPFPFDSALRDARRDLREVDRARPSRSRSRRSARRSPAGAR